MNQLMPGVSNYYNSVRAGDRENNFKDAKLGYVFEAVTACAVMLCAQFGKRAFGWSPAMQFIEFTKVPESELS